MRAADPRLLVTVARGSSDHAATYLKYAVELAAGVPVASVGPSVASIYGRRLRLDGAACLGISQSGQSPDIVEMMRSAAGRRRADGRDHQRRATRRWRRPATIRCRCRPGRSGASRRPRPSSASVLAALALVAEWREDDGLRAAVAALPEQFAAALELRLDAARRPAGAGELGLRARAGPGLRHRQRDGAEVQGDLRHPRRELQRGGGAARAGGAGAGAASRCWRSGSPTRRCPR